MVLIIRKKVLFIGDFGIDDIVALLFAYYSKSIDIVGIVVDYGNISKKNATITARYIQEITQLTDIPIIGGADRPLTGEQPTYFPEIHGEYGLGPITPDLSEPIPEFENFYEILTVINQYPNEISIVNVGRLTSLATAIVLYPNFLSQVKEFFIMGGAFLFPGNATPIAEANFYSDHYAANLVISNVEKVKIFPLNVTNYAIIPDNIINQLDQYFKRTGDSVGQLLKPIITYYSDWYKKRDPSISGGPMHDLLTLWAVTNSNQFQFVDKPVKINTEDGVARGQSIGDFRPYKELEKYPIHSIAIKFDYQFYIENVYSTFVNGNKFY
ncbi:nucleoside hydrolase [Metabacillus litoralis]|uniref:nucleoside hydrolase n=1 Tax=Metabacillus litoralis TaxID=152268 RepID=UPI00203DAAB4|nr:nucleoside hydrolase [Metabacillus litoralis]